VADYDRLPDEPRYELVFGRFHLTPSPFPRHQAVTQVLCRHLENIAESAGGIAFQAPLDVVLADHSVVQPDLMYVLSPGTARFDRGRKLQLYALYGIEEYWLVDHERRQVDFLIKEAGSFVAALPVAGRYQSARIPEVHLDLTRLWRQVDARLRRVPRAL
jgi:Uma2 family endonuclease